MSPENQFDHSSTPKPGEAKKLLITASIIVLTVPGLLLAAAIYFKDIARKPEIESLESAIRSVGTQIKQRNDCDKNVQGYYKFLEDDNEVIADEVVICANNFSYTVDNYPALLKHEMTHIMHACLGTTINSPDEIRELRRELKVRNESSYRTIHRGYSETEHFEEVEARWMELQDYKYVNNQLQKHCVRGW